MFNKIRNAWKLRNANIIDVKDLSIFEIDEAIKKTGASHIDFGEGMVIKVKDDHVEGDGKAVFFSEGTEEDYKEFQREEEGMKSWYERLKNL